VLEREDLMQPDRPHALLRNGVPAHLCGAQHKGEPEPCRTLRGECARHCAANLKTKPGERCPTPPMRNGRCRMHGGRSLRGVAHPSFRDGRFSKSIPARLSQSYEEALADPGRLELADELAVIVARNREMLESLYSGESDGLWRLLRDHKRAMEKARRVGDGDAAVAALNTILRLIECGAADAERWAELMANVDQQRKLAESERRRRVEDQQMATVEEVMALMGAILAIITRHVSDERIRRAIG
jgi:hypothetical protein